MPRTFDLGRCDKFSDSADGKMANLARDGGRSARHLRGGSAAAKSRRSSDTSLQRTRAVYVGRWTLEQGEEDSGSGAASGGAERGEQRRNRKRRGAAARGRRETADTAAEAYARGVFRHRVTQGGGRSVGVCPFGSKKSRAHVTRQPRVSVALRVRSEDVRRSRAEMEADESGKCCQCSRLGAIKRLIS